MSDTTVHSGAAIDAAMASFRRGELEQTLSICRMLLAKQADRADAVALLGLTHERLNEFGQAEEHLRCAVKMRPDLPEYHNNLGSLLGRLGELEESVALFQRALALRPTYGRAHGNLGISLMRLGQVDQAVHSLRRAIELQPGDTDQHMNLARALLLTGDYQSGFVEFEWRLRDSILRTNDQSTPMWNGQPLDNRSILLHCEQGLGDSLQFGRFASLLADQGARVVLSCQPKLCALLQSLPRVAAVLPDDQQTPPTDFQLRLMSVPRVVRTTVDSIPDFSPYLSCDPTQLAHWRSRLGASGDAIKIGIAWQGSPNYYSDRQRSIPLPAFAPLFDLPGVRLFSLQKGVGAEQLMDLPRRAAVIDLGAQLDNGGDAFVDTAAAMMNLDLIITSDTAIAHLAGALGVPVWVALPFVPDWRWLMHRDDSPWYPTMRLFRQHERGEWADVFQRIAGALRQTVELRQDVEGGAAAPRASIQIGIGELVDRITILQLKTEHAHTLEFQTSLRTELDALQLACDATIPAHLLVDTYRRSLLAINRRLWQVEDDLRSWETRKEFGKCFIELARSVPRLNDQRGALKERLNRLLGSVQTEVKIYSARASSRPPALRPDAQNTVAVISPVSVQLAIEQLERNRLEEACQTANQILSLEPDNARAMHVLGMVALRQEKHPQAIEWMLRSIQIEPLVAAFHNNLGEAFRETEQFDQAVSCYLQALLLKPDYAEAHYNLGIAYRYQNHIEQSIASHERAIALIPNDPDAHLNLALCLLLSGDLQRGFAEYEWRWRTPSFGSPQSQFVQPLWKGQELDGKTIFVHAEQGFGDSIQFARFVPLLAGRGAKVIVEVQPELKRLFKTLDGYERIVARGEAPGHFDFQCPFMSLPLGLGTTLTTIPSSVPYLGADSQRSSDWATRLGATTSGRIKVGLVWAGRPTHKNDHHRSLALSQLAPLAAVRNASFISLQQGGAAQQLDSEPAGFQIERIGALEDFADTAAIIAALDLVISVDTSVAHLAGALAKPIWLLSPWVGDWRWLQDRQNSPWYPTMRVFRQPKANCWEPVIEVIAAELTTLVPIKHSC